MKRVCINFAAFACLAGAAGSACADVTISSDTTENISCTAGICVPTAASAVLNVGDLENLLAAGNVEIATTGTGVQANNIDVSANLAWTGAATLTLDAYQSITFESTVADTGTGGLALLTNDGGSGGALSFGPSGNVTFQNLTSPLLINGNAYTLVNSVASLIQTGGSGFVALAQSYDASQDGTYASSPVETLSGTFEGLGNTISNLSIDDANAEYVGFFGSVAQGASARDIGLANVNIDSTNETNLGVGALAGESAGQIFGAWSSGAVASARSTVGGLIGRTSAGTIANSYSGAAVTADVDGGGGLVGETVHTTLDNCYATGEVENTLPSWVGGLLGSASQSFIENSFATGNAKGKSQEGEGSYVGGLIGISLYRSKIENSYATGNADAGSYSEVGGLIGDIAYGGKFTKSYANGAVSGGNGSSVGGLVGTIDQNKDVPSFQDIYWDTDTSGTDQGTGNVGTVNGMTGLTTAQFQAGLPNGFSARYWTENGNGHEGSQINGGFPYLIANPPQ